MRAAAGISEQAREEAADGPLRRPGSGLDHASGIAARASAARTDSSNAGVFPSSTATGGSTLPTSCSLRLPWRLLPALLRKPLSAVQQIHTADLARMVLPHLLVSGSPKQLQTPAALAGIKQHFFAGGRLVGAQSPSGGLFAIEARYSGGNGTQASSGTDLGGAALVLELRVSEPSELPLLRCAVAQRLAAAVESGTIAVAGAGLPGAGAQTAPGM